MSIRFGHSIIPSVYEKLSAVGKDHQYEHGLYLLDMPTGSGKSFACSVVAKRLLQGEYPFNRKIWLISNQNKNLEDFVKELEPFGALRLKDQVSTVQDFFEKHPDYVGEVRSCPCIAEYECTTYIIDLLSSMKEGVDQFNRNNTSKQFQKYIREDIVQKNIHAVKIKIGEIISLNIGKKNWSRPRLLETLKVEIPWCVDLFPDIKINESKVIICTYTKFIKAQKSFPLGNQYLWELCNDDIIMMDEFETSKSDFLNYSIEISMNNGYDIVSSFTNIRNCLVSKIQPDSIYARKPFHKDKSKREILYNIKLQFNKIYEEFQFHKNIKTKEDKNLKGFNNVIFSNQSIQLEANTAYLKFEEDRNYIVYNKDGETKYTVASLVFEASSAIYDFAKTIQYNFLPDYHEAFDGDLSSYYDDLESLYKTFGFDDECISYLLMQNKIIDLKRELGIGKDKGVDSLYDTFPAMSYRIFENIPNNKEITVIRDYNVSYSPESWIVALAYKNIVLGLSATSRVDSVFINYDLGFFRDKGILREVPFEIMAAMEEEFEKRYDYNGNGLIDITVNILGKGFTDVGKEYFEKIEALKEQYKGIFTDGDITDPTINNFILAGGDNYAMKQWYRIISAIHCYLVNGGFAMLALTNKKHFSDDKKKGDIVYIVNRMKENLGITEDIWVEFLFTDKFDENFSKLREEKLDKGIRTIVLSNIEAVARGVNLTYTVRPENIDKTVIVDYLNEYDNTDPKFMDTCFDFLYIEHKTYVGPQYKQTLDPYETRKSFLSFSYGIATMFDHRDCSEITFKEAEAYLRLSLLIGTSLGDFDKKKYNKYRKCISQSPSFSKALYIYLAQIVGRITRTPRRARHTCIILDDEWAQTDFDYITQGNWVVPELRVIKDALEKYKPFKVDGYHSYATAQRNAMRLSNEYREINRVIRTDILRAKEYKNRLAELNDYILKHIAGIYTDDMTSDPNAQFVLMELPEGTDGYSFTKGWHNEYRRVERFEIFESKFADGKEKTVFTCSLKSMGEKLEEILRLPGVKDRFIRQGWQTVLPKAKDLEDGKRYILNPEAFMKWEGLLGEIAFEEFCKQHGIKTEPFIDELFELADFSVNGNIAIDIKNWQWDINENGLINYISNKYDILADAGYKALILINLFPTAGNARFEARRIKDCGENRNVFSFTNFADISTNSADWSIESFETLKRAINRYKEDDEL